MKKTLISVLALALSASAMAITIPDVVGIVLKANNGQQASSRWYQAADAIDTEFQTGKDATALNMPAGDGSGSEQVFIYNAAPYGNMSSLYTTKLEGKYISIKTNNVDTKYSLEFDALYPDAKEIRIIDHELDSIFKVVKNAKYEFEAAPNKTYATRFQFYQPFTPDAGELAVCVYYNSIEITNNPYTDNIVVKDMEGNVVLTKAPRATPQVISLENLASGHYVLVIGEKSYEFFNKPVSNN